MTTTIYTHEDCLDHKPGQQHPECPNRLNSVMHGLQLSDIANQIDIIAAPLAQESLLLLAHSHEHIQLIKSSAPITGTHALDGDTIMSPSSLNAALRATGAACAGIDGLVSGTMNSVFCATRPPGHHATRDHAMGFCLFNHIAIAALYAKDKYAFKRIAIVDFDVHHGNGTQDIISGEKGIFYISTHQSPLYPGGGGINENISGNILNIPLDSGTSHQDYLSIFKSSVIPALQEFQPELILVSAGFDAHTQDPLASLELTNESYHWLGLQLKQIALQFCAGKILCVLEGGYHLTALGESANAFIRGMNTSQAKPKSPESLR